MSAPISRRTVVVGAAWSVPVIMVAVAVPLAAASTVAEDPVISCVPLDGKGQPTYLVTRMSGATRIVDQGEVNRDKDLQAACRGKGPKS